MQKTFIKGYVTKGEGNKYRVLASSATVDRQGDSINQSGWDLGNFMKNPVMPWAHKYDQLPIAKVTDIQTTDKGLEAEFEFAPEEGNPVAQQVKVLYDNGFLNAVSVGFIPKERKGNSITKAELLEISFVPVPANQEALRLSIKSLEDAEDTPAEVKSALELLKGAVADELAEEEALEAKCQKFGEVMEVIYAFADVYFDEMTPVEDFASLLTEAITLLQAVVANDGMDDDDTEETTESASTASFKKMIAEKGMTTGAFEKFFEMKAGAKLSKDTMTEINKALSSIADAQSVLEDLKASSASQDGSSTDDSGTESGDENTDEEKALTLTSEDLATIRQTLVATDKMSELALSIVNAKMREIGAKK